MKLFHSLKAEAAPIAFFIAFFWPAIFSDMYFVGADSLVCSYPKLRWQ